KRGWESQSQYDSRPIPALGFISNGQTFQRIEQELSWSDALRYCQLYHTDLADLQSAGSVSSLKDIYSLTSSTEVWIGLYFNVNIKGLAWSSGSAFSKLEGISTPALKEGYCATLYATVGVFPTLGAASCTMQKPFICYYDSSVGHRLTTKSPLILTTSPPKAATVQINGENFIRFEQKKTWMEALQYCRSHYTDLADLQRVTDEAGMEAMKSITSENQAWIGLYFNAASGLLSWSSDLGDSIPAWLQVPQLGAGLCAGLGIYARYPPRVYAEVCFSQRPFICFHGACHSMPAGLGIRKPGFAPQRLVASGRHPGAQVRVCRGSAQRPLSPAVGPGASTADSSQYPASEMWILQRLSPEPTEPTESRAPGAFTNPTAPSSLAQREVPENASILELGSSTPLVLGQTVSFSPMTWATPGPSPTSPEDGSDIQEETGTLLASVSSPAAVPMTREPTVTQSRPGTTRETASSPLLGSIHRASATPTGTSSGSHGSTTPVVEEQTLESFSPENPAAPQRTTASPEWTTGSWAALSEPSGNRPGQKTAVTSTSSDTERKATAPATQAQHLSPSEGPESKDKAPEPESGQYLGVLKADFNVPALTDPEEMKGHFLSEVKLLLTSHFDQSEGLTVQSRAAKTNIQEALKLTLGHQQFTLKWVGFEVNKTEN
ncbi:putative C-type lectin domain family 20 member A, partial [Galemys pyrenaicus]